MHCLRDPDFELADPITRGKSDEIFATVSPGNISAQATEEGMTPLRGAPPPLGSLAMASASPAKMKVADLRAALAERGVSTAGLKAELVQRLERKMAEERRVDVPRGSFGLNSSTPPRASPSSTSGVPSTSGVAFGSPHRHHAEARVTLSPHRHHEQRRGLWGVPMSEA